MSSEPQGISTRQPGSAVVNEAPVAWLAYFIAAGSALSLLMGMAILVAFFAPLAWLMVLIMQGSVNSEPARAHVRRARTALGAHVLLSVAAFLLSAVLIFSMAGLSPQSIAMAIDIIELEGFGIIFTEPFWGTVLHDYVSNEARSGIGVILMILGAPILGTLIGCVVGLVSLIRLVFAMQKLGDGLPP